MKAYLFLGIYAAVACCASGQDQGSLQDAVRTSIFGGISEGQRVKELQRGGDAVAVAITKVVGDTPLSESQLEITLDVLEQSFSRLNWVTVPSDREPRSTLFLLDALRCSSPNSALTKKIAETKRAVVTSAQRFRDHPG